MTSVTGGYTPPVDLSGITASITALMAAQAGEASVAQLQALSDSLSGSLSGLSSTITLLQANDALSLAGPFTVQSGGANPLLSYNTTNLKPGTIASVSDLGGCGTAGSNGYGLAYWIGTRWIRLSRGTTKVIAPAATINLDYWKDPMLVSLSGNTALTTNILIANAPDGARYGIVKPGISSLLSAFGVGLVNVTGSIAIVGPSPGFFEVVSGALSQVYAS